jgi:serine protease
VARGARGEALLAVEGDDRIDTAFRALGIEHLSGSLHGLERGARLRSATRRLAKAMRSRADVLSADPNYIRRATATPTDEFYLHQWHYPLIGLPPAWDNVEPDSGIVVAVIDTGIIPNHPELQGQLVEGYDFVSNVVTAGDGNGCDSDPTDPGDSLAASSWHGTHVAGTVAARTSFQAGDGSGVAGVAWNARVMPLRALGIGGGTDFDLIQALYYAAGLGNACGVLPDQPVDVINLSLGGPDASTALETALAEVRQEGVVVVAAAGNFSTSAPFYPATYPDTISVSAVDAAKRLAPYSNFGPDIDVAAPGGNLAQDLGGDGFPDGVLSTLFDPFASSDSFVYGFSQGTSMAAPHVSGVVALMLGVNGDLTPAGIDSLLAQGRLSEDIGSSFLFGNGMIDAYAAVSAAFEAAGDEPPVATPRLRADSSALTFGASGTAADVELSNSGGDDSVLVIEGFSASSVDGGSWLSISEAAVDAEGLGRYRVAVDRAGLSPGIYSGTLLFDSNENDVEVAVLMQVGSFAAGSLDAGRHFVLLVDPDTMETVAALAVTSSDGRYSFRFDDIDPGDYLIFAGTDFDNDLLICDPGEACGAYRTLDQPERLEVDGDMLALDFGTGFELRLSEASGSGPGGGISRAISRRLY